jgi:hypothetical protein
MLVSIGICVTRASSCFMQFQETQLQLSICDTPCHVMSAPPHSRSAPLISIARAAAAYFNFLSPCLLLWWLATMRCRLLAVRMVRVPTRYVRALHTLACVHLLVTGTRDCVILAMFLDPRQTMACIR